MSSSPKPIAASTDALAMLEADHRAVEQLFDAFERAGKTTSSARRRSCSAHANC